MHELEERSPHTPTSTTFIPEADPIDGSLIAIANLFLRRRRLLIVATGSVAILVFSLVMVRRGYTATSMIMPYDASANASRLAGLAAQFGVNVGAASVGDPVEFYSALISSDGILKDVARTNFRAAKGTDGRDSVSGTLLDLLNISGGSPQERLQNAAIKLRKRISASTDNVASIVTVKSTAPWPDLAEKINRRVLELVNEFNVHKRQTQAGSERQFVQVQFERAQKDLNGAEDELEAFLTANRSYQSDPRLVFQAARLQRRIELKQEVFTTLAQSLEQVKIDEVRNTPVFTIISAPEGSAQPSIKVLLAIVLAIMTGFLTAVGLTFGADYLEKQRLTNPGAYADLTRLSRDAMSGIPLRRRGGAKA